MYRITLHKEEDGRGYPSCSSPEKAVKIFYDMVQKDDPREHFVIIAASGGLEALGAMEASVGGSVSCTIDPRVVLKVALDTFARGVILVHNHPTSNRCIPSQEDINETERVKSALATIGCKLFDHVIIAGSEAYSYANEQTFPLDKIV